MKLCRKEYWISEKLLFLGTVGKYNNFETEIRKETIIIDNKETIDNYEDDSALVYLSENGLVIITGCSHSGICNIIEQSQILTGEKRIIDVIGGFHLLNAKIFLSNYTDVLEVWSGKEIVYL